jgi:hypothetical protein
MFVTLISVDSMYSASLCSLYVIGTWLFCNNRFLVMYVGNKLAGLNA